MLQSGINKIVLNLHVLHQKSIRIIVVGQNPSYSCRRINNNSWFLLSKKVLNRRLISQIEFFAGFAYKMPLGIVMRMCLEGKHFKVNAQQAYQWGLVSEVVPNDQLINKAWEIATHIAEDAAPLAVKGSKKAILGAIDRGPTEGIPFTWEVLTEIQDTADTKEGFLSFVEKRKPKFIGR